MRLVRIYRTLLFCLAGLCLFGWMPLPVANRSLRTKRTPQRARAMTAGLKLPAGFCATVFADSIGHARQMVVSASGVLYVNTWSGTYYGNDTPHPGGFLVALQDKSGAGKADVVERFGETASDRRARRDGHRTCIRTGFTRRSTIES